MELKAHQFFISYRAISNHRPLSREKIIHGSKNHSKRPFVILETQVAYFFRNTFFISYG